MRAGGVIYNRTFGPQRCVPKYVSLGHSPTVVPTSPEDGGGGQQDRVIRSHRIVSLSPLLLCNSTALKCKKGSPHTIKTHKLDTGPHQTLYNSV